MRADLLMQRQKAPAHVITDAITVLRSASYCGLRHKRLRSMCAFLESFRFAFKYSPALFF